MANIYSIMTFILGSFSILALLTSFKNKVIYKFIRIIILIFSFIILYFAQETGRSGGEIRHTEIRNNNNYNTIIED